MVRSLGIGLSLSVNVLLGWNRVGLQFLEVQFLVAVEIRNLNEPSLTIPEIANIWRFPLMLPNVFLQCSGMRKCFGAVRIMALIGFDPLMRSFMCPQVTRMCKAFPTSGEFALKRFFTRVHSQVRSQF